MIEAGTPLKKKNQHMGNWMVNHASSIFSAQCMQLHNIIFLVTVVQNSIIHQHGLSHKHCRKVLPLQVQAWLNKMARQSSYCSFGRRQRSSRAIRKDRQVVAMKELRILGWGGGGRRRRSVLSRVRPRWIGNLSSHVPKCRWNEGGINENRPYTKS